MMQKPNNAVLLVGSPKGQNSTSGSLGTYLFEQLQQNGVKTEKVYLCQCLGSDEKQAALLRLVDASDLIVLAFPLYVDSLHSYAIKTLELIAEHEKGKSELVKKSFAAIANSGFPEAKHNDTALAMCRLFVKQVGFTWAGGLAMGGGGTISGRPIAEVGGAVRNQIKALKIAADSLAKGEPIPEEAIGLMSKLGYPKRMYTLMANRNWKQEAKKTIAIKKMYDKPCKEACL